MARSRKSHNPGARRLAVVGVALGALALLLIAALHRQVLSRPAAPVSEASSTEIRKIVFHADFADPRRLAGMLASAGRLVDSYQQDQQRYDVRIVFVAHAIRFVTDDPLKRTPYAEDRTLRERLLALHDDHGVKLELCNLTRESIGLEEGRLYPGVELVPVGEARIAELQGLGYAYLKNE